MIAQICMLCLDYSMNDGWPLMHRSSLVSFVSMSISSFLRPHALILISSALSQVCHENKHCMVGPINS